MKQLHVLAMRPTQFALGLQEVESKVKKLKNMSAKQRKRFMEDRLIQIVIGPKNIPYIVDHHHMVRACWETGIKKVPIEIKADLSKVQQTSFWHMMSLAHWVHPFDQFGTKQDPDLLPLDIRGMADDPYRSLAWAVREAGGYDKVFVPFAEFRWANYFRKVISIDDLRNNFDRAIKKALKACKTRGGAVDLPGYKA